MGTFELSNFTKRTSALLHDAEDVFDQYDLPEDDLPSIPAAKEAIKLVFVGQYSAGKSSIIKMLTKIDTGIGAGIKTQESHAYEWNGIEIIDTPGIQTGVRPDHDEITYHEIDHAALLIFVITNEGFDQTMGDHFRKLAIEGQRGANMILVINKMDRAVQGNTPAQHEVMRPDIERVIAPLTMDGLYTSFVSTDRYEEALSETDDEEFHQALLEESGYETFIANLNAFVRAKKLSARLQKPLFELIAAIENIIGTEKEQHAIDGAEELAKRKLRIVRDGRQRCEAMLQDIALTCQSDIKEIGRKASLAIQAGVDEETLKQALDAAGKEAEQRIQLCMKDMDQAFQNTLAGVSEEMNEQLQSPFARQVRQELEENGLSLLPVATDGNVEEIAAKKAWAPTSTPAEAPDASSLASKLVAAQQFGDKLAAAAINQGSDLAGKVAQNGAVGSFTDVLTASLKGFSGSKAHGVIKGAGHLFGVKFKPWQALKITKGIATFGKVIGVVGAIYSLYSSVTAGDKAKKAEEELRAARDEVRQNFQESATQAYGEMMQAVEARFTESIDPTIAALEDNVQAFEDRKAQMAAYTEALQAIETRAQALLQDIQNA